MMVVIADTAPIHYLVLIEAIDVLARFFDQVIVPRTVEQELLNASAPETVREWMRHHPPWIEIRSALQIKALNLDPGEAEAIALAKELGAFAVLLDDGEDREAAKLVEDENRDVRWAALNTLTRYRPHPVSTISNIVHYLRIGLDDPDADVHGTAAMLLRRYGASAKAAVPRLDELAKEDPMRRSIFLKTLKHIDPEAADELANKSSDPWLRETAKPANP